MSPMTERISKQQRKQVIRVALGLLQRIDVDATVKTRKDGSTVITIPAAAK
ncbi:hypothetical protein G4X40_19825 [Rhodococcus sp. D2-41]|uniref:hypothetical protein n=1 Tax=Speluncibacter jeojiensis TaxID=2710754 RepID=UPI0024103A91|nr:hypothetical protein [Rhodococcus sp. D2-41]MDG3012393.1 hypothetical protein [Rhodococcus sp. D2-41]